MDSRIIFESAKTYIYTVEWIKAKIGFESEWIYFGNPTELNLKTIINEYFNEDVLFVALHRNDSFQSNRESIAEEIQHLMGTADFTIWNHTFQKVIEFNKMGVYRKGSKPYF
jgi:hypothetical protein